MEKKQIVMFGGCFNPPLNSHFSLAEHLVNQYHEIEKIVFVPVNEKYQKISLISNEHRYNMLKLVCDENERFEVSRIEIDNVRQLYTIETLRKLKDIYSNYDIAFLLGSDNLKELHTWYKADKLVENFKIYVLERDKDNIENIIEENNFLKKHKRTFIKAENTINTNLSSTFIRKILKSNKSIRYLAPEQVVNYINKNRLYC